MTARTLWRAALGALALISLAFVGCDERNDADRPETVYHLAMSLELPGVALYVDARDDMLGVAASSAGTYVFDISNVGAPVQQFHFKPNGELYSEFVAVDPINDLVMTFAGPATAPGDKYPIHQLSDSTRIGGGAFTGGIIEVDISSKPDEFVAWKSDRIDGVKHTSYCYIADSARWRPDYCTTFYFDYNPNFGSPRGGFGIRDSLIAIAQVNYEIRIHNVNTGVETAVLEVPGDPQDCAWHGNFILVADNFFLTTVDASDVTAPEVVGSYLIQGADRLQRIVVDGNYAILLDDSDGLYVVDVTSPADPELIQSISLPEVSSVAVTNEKLIVSDEQLGVLIYTR